MELEKSNEKIRKVFLDDLPKWGKSGKAKEGSIDWKNSVGHKVYFIYDDIEGQIEIIDYDRRYLYIKYLDKPITKIFTGSFSKCLLGNILDKHTSNFKIEIGTRFKDSKRDITIIDRKRERDETGHWYKYYKYHCNICNFNGDNHWSIKDKMYKNELWTKESDLIGNQKTGCSCCCNPSQIVVGGINDILTTDKWLISIINDDEFCKTHTHSCGDKVYPICPDCGRRALREMSINEIYSRHGMSCTCGDGVSMPNKIAFNLLEQLEIKFEKEYSPKWCKYLYKNKYRQGYYDFYFELNNKKYIVEMDGGLGHGKKIHGLSKQTKSETQLIDNEKDRLAKEHGIEVIRINCDYPNINNSFDYIKQNILSDYRLNKLFNLSKINWFQIEEFTMTNLVKVACDYKRNNPTMSTTKIGKLINLSVHTIRTYLKKGSKLGWCHYNPNEKKIKTTKKQKNTKKVEILKNGISLGIFKSILELDRRSEELYGVKLKFRSISKICLGQQKKSIKDLHLDIYI